MNSDASVLKQALENLKMVDSYYREIWRDGLLHVMTELEFFSRVCTIIKKVLCSDNSVLLPRTCTYLSSSLIPHPSSSNNAKNSAPVYGNSIPHSLHRQTHAPSSHPHPHPRPPYSTIKIIHALVSQTPQPHPVPPTHPRPPFSQQTGRARREMQPSPATWPTIGSASNPGTQ